MRLRGPFSRASAIGRPHENHERGGGARSPPATGPLVGVAMSETEDVASRTEPTEAEGDDDRRADSGDLDDLPDGSGCAEIWDYLSERRRGD